MKKLISFLILILVYISFSQPDPDDIYWSKEYAMPVQDPVKAMLVDGDYVYYNEYGRLIKLNKTNYEYEILGITGGGSYRSILKHNDKIYICGDFESITGSKAKFLAVWNGTKWDSVASRTDGRINTMCFDNDGNLWVGGTFTSVGDQPSGRIAMWDGKIWHTFPGFEAEVRTIINYNNTICVGGDFQYSVDYQKEYSKVVFFDKSTGQFLNVGNKLGSEQGSKVFTLTTDTSGNLFAGGMFYEADGITLSENVAMFNGTQWQSLGNGLNSQVTSLIYAQGKLYAGGLFDASGTDKYIVGMAVYTNNSWQSPGQILRPGGVENPFVLCLAKDSSDNVYFGGYFRKVDNVDCWGIIEWTGKKVISFMPGIRNGAISAIADMTIDTVNDLLYVGGGFVRTGDVVSYGISRYDGFNWQGCNTGLTPSSNVVYSMQSLHDTIYFTGWFNFADSIRLINVAKWINSKKTWEQIGTGIPGNDGDLGPILVLADNDVYIGGNITQVTEAIHDTITPINYITHWNGTAWEQMGKGLAMKDTAHSPSPEKIVRGNDGLIYVIGTFDKAGDSDAMNVAVWNPQLREWEPFAGDIPGSVYSLLIDGDDYYFGGTFNTAGNLNSVNNIVKWNRTTNTWSRLDSGVTGSVSSIIKWGEDLYITGYFEYASGKKCNSIARYNLAQNKFYPLGSGLLYGNIPGRGSALKVYKNDLYVSGNFTTAGYKNPSSNFARWMKLNVSVDQEVNLNIHEINLYPNPARNRINLNVFAEADHFCNIILYDIIGNPIRQIFSGDVVRGINEFSFDTEWLASGNYTISISSKTGVQTKNFVIIK